MTATSLRAVGDELVEIIEVEGAVGVQFDAFDDRAGALAGLIPRHGVAVVLHPGGENLVAFLQIGPRPGIGNEVDGLGRAAGENDVLGRRRR